MTAKIGLKDVRIHAPHGYFEEEHHMGNEFSIDVEVDARIGAAASEDDLGQTVNYATIYYLLKVEMKHPTQLLETLAYRMAARIADQFDNVTAVKLRLHKLNPPLGGKVGASWVEVNVSSKAGSGGYDDGFGQARTFDDYVPHFDVDGPFAGRGGGGSMTGAPPTPRPINPRVPSPSGNLSKSPPLPPTPPMVFDDDAFEMMDDEDSLFLEDDDQSAEEGHAVSDESFTLDDFALPDDFDPNELSDLGFNFDFDLDDRKD